MFIYHFSRLIKSKLIWGLLALLMVFAFVVADSCRSASPNANVAGFLDGNAVTYQESESAAKTLSILSEYAYFLPPGAQIFGALLRTDSGESDEAVLARRQAVWKLLAAREVAQAHGLTTTQAGAEQVLARFFTDGQGVFNPGYYRAFLRLRLAARADDDLLRLQRRRLGLADGAGLPPRCALRHHHPLHRHPQVRHQG